LQASIEYITKISLKEVRVHYDAAEAEEAGTATLNKYPDVYVAPGQKKQLGDALWDIARTLQQEQQTSTETETPPQQSPMPL
jgi:hypothetical protein